MRRYDPLGRGQMVDVPITIACGNYDRTRPIMDGRVKVEGCAVTYLPLYPEEIFFRAFRYHEFDVCELSFSSYLRTVVDGTSAYAGIPAFVSRIFRHSGIYVRSDAGIHAPADLRGKRVGLPEYQITAVVWMRGLMQHEYGVAPHEIHWRSGGLEEPGRDERTRLKPIPGLDLKPIGEGKTLVGMLRDGELDALFTARPPSSFLRREPHIARLFQNTRQAEMAYFKKTGLFPIMHLVGIRKSLLAQYPWLATSLYKAFCEAKALAMADLRDVNALVVTLPFLEAETRETMAAMGEDFWRYGVHENRPEIEALTGYAFEQGLIDRKPALEELFAPSVFEISKV
jgi:4,5-dihydroxyphthalate decarboxylase